MKDKSIQECHSYIQTNLIAPKGKTNNFVNYKYRNIEDIMEALKPLLEETECALICSDDMVMIGERYYIKASVSLTKGTDSITTTSFARESLQRPKMDEPQCTGTASTYARKYAVCGLFAIDDGQDVDGMDNTKMNSYYPSDLEKGEYQRLKDHKCFSQKDKNGKTFRSVIKDKWANYTTQEEVLKCLKGMEEKIRQFETKEKEGA